MKRNFYALFALLTALSGPLVMAPPAISKPKTEVSAKDERKIDDAERDGHSGARFEQQHNQPTCQFMLESGPAPEDLIVLPEDFDYELFKEQEPCEMPQIAASKSNLDAEIGAVDSNEYVPLAIDAGPVDDQLCLPNSEWLPNIEPWDGPAIAGIDSFEAPSNESLETESVAAPNGCWAANLVARGTYALASTLSRTTCLAGEEVVNGIHWIEEIKVQKTRELLEILGTTGQMTLEFVADRFTSISQAISIKDLTSIQIHQAERPYCHCWAMPELQVTEADSDSTQETPAQNQLDFAVESPAADSLPESDALPEVPHYQVQLNNTNALQNDAVEQPRTAPVDQGEPVDTVDLDAIREAAKQAWDIILDKAAMVDRLSKDYDFEPFSAEELEKRNSLE